MLDNMNRCEVAEIGEIAPAALAAVSVTVNRLRRLRVQRLGPPSDQSFLLLGSTVSQLREASESLRRRKRDAEPGDGQPQQDPTRGNEVGDPCYLQLDGVVPHLARASRRKCSQERR